MLSIVRMFVQKISEKTEKRIKSLSKRAMKSRKEDDV